MLRARLGRARYAVLSALRDTTHELRREAWAIARQGRLMARRGRQVDVPCDRHVVFVHGFMAHGAVFAPMREHVVRECDVDTVEVSYGPFERFEVVAERVHAAVTGAPPGPVVLVGHSLGGLLSRWCMQELGGHTRVERLVTLASPHGGTTAASVPFGPLARAIRPGSKHLKTLDAGAHRVAHLPHVAIVAARDRMILPPSSAAAVPRAQVTWMHDLGHNEILFDARVFALVADAIGRRGTRAR